jgi:branched-chain amino acid transport system substrate-binding protein
MVTGGFNKFASSRSALARSVLLVGSLLVSTLVLGCEDRKPAPAPAVSPAAAATAPAAPAASAAATETRPTAASASPAAGPILIGHYGSLTGPQATFGKSTSNGIRLAIKEFNAAGGLGGRLIELKEYDTKGESREAGTAVTRLVTADKVTAVLGEVASSLSLVGGRVAQQYGVPMISPSSTNPAVTTIGDMVSRVCFIDPFQGFVAAKFASENKKVTKVATLFDQSQAYSKGLKDDFKRAFEKMGGTVATEQAYNSSDPDFTAALTAIRASNPQMIYVPGYYTDVGNIAVQARRLGITAPMLGGDGWDSAELAKIAKDAIVGSYYSNHYSPDQPEEVVRGFIARYNKEYGETPDGLAAMGYDAAKLLFAAMGRAKTLGGKDLAAAINSTKDFPGVTGSITIDEQRNARKAAVMVEMKKVGDAIVPAYAATISPDEKK